VITWNEQEPEFRRLPIEDLCCRLPFTTACAILLSRDQTPKVVASRSVLEAVFDHLRERPVEMGGLLIGAVHDLADSSSSFVIAVTDSVRSVEYNATGVSLRMEPDVWEKARMKTAADRVVIGWYHSHPNLGAFFSGTDRKTQRAFFYHPHSVGLVIDPIRNEEKWFLGADSDELLPTTVLRTSLPQFTRR
jgi:proteasome lid subunit RPN8/RPN11